MRRAKPWKTRRAPVLRSQVVLDMLLALIESKAG